MAQYNPRLYTDTNNVLCKIIVERAANNRPYKTHQHLKCRGGNLPPVKCIVKGEIYTKATGIVRRVDDLGRIVIPKEIRRTLKIREGDPLLTTLTPIDRFCMAIHSLVQRITAE